ncbi:MAG: hypothetical protein IJ600_09310 [Lachnospiraceae bacterium]|nr:hypothetical protein [Lachnospiraceae bacterium]
MHRKNALRGVKVQNLLQKAFVLVMAAVLYVNLFGGTFVLQAEAADPTVEGTVEKDTTDDLLKLNTSGGIMSIKMDSDIKITGAGVLTQGMKVKVSYTYGSDKYLHTKYIEAPSGTTWGATINTANTVTVTGKVLDGTDRSTMVLDYYGSALKIRLDSTTVFENCRYLYKDRTVNVTVAQGSDAYLHAVKIGTEVVALSSSLMGTVDKTADGKTLATVSGTVQDGCTDEMFNLKVSGNIMKIKIDANTDVSLIHALIPGTTITAAIYTGDDRYLHAYKLAGSIALQNSAVRDTSNSITVTGTVQKNTTDNILYLSTNGGNMTIKLDTDTNISKNGLLVIGKKVNVTAQRGSDAYLHAVTISSDSTYGASIGSVVAMSETTGKTSADIKVEGTVKKETTNAVLQLSTSGGDMTIRIDANTKWTDSTAVKTGEKVTAVVYRGEDKYMHAASVTSKLDTPPATTLNGASQVAFTGTLRKVDGYTLTVKTAEGDQIFRFDNSSDFKEYRLLQEDRTVTVIGVVGADGYWHVKSISG